MITMSTMKVTASTLIHDDLSVHVLNFAVDNGDDAVVDDCCLRMIIMVTTMMAVCDDDDDCDSG